MRLNIPVMSLHVDHTHLHVHNIIYTCCSQMDPDHDRKVSEHVLRMHRYRNPGEQDGEGLTCNY